jgi:hypothetical protein
MGVQNSQQIRRESAPPVGSRVIDHSGGIITWARNELWELCRSGQMEAFFDSVAHGVEMEVKGGV